MSKNAVKYPCDGCTVAYPDSEICSRYYKCSAYIEWFGEEWRKIRTAAGVTKSMETKSKYKNRKICFDGMVFDSQKEFNRYGAYAPSAGR